MHNKHHIVVWMATPLAALSYLLLSACVASTQGGVFRQDTANSSRYNITIYTQGLAGPDTADQRLEQEISDFMTTNGFASYEISDRSSSPEKHSFNYSVLFSKGADTFHFKKPQYQP